MKHLIEYQEWVKTGIIENFQGERFDISSLEDKDRAVWFQKDLTFKNCPNLKKIEVDNCNLVSLKIENCPQLEHFSAYHNEIKELDFAGCKKLKFIYVPFNGRVNPTEKGAYEFCLEKINLKDCVNLEVLDVGVNKIRDLDLSNNNKLKTLSCDRSFSLGKLNIKHLTDLEALRCSYCPFLHELDLSSLDNLKEVYCFNNVYYDRNGNPLGLKKLVLNGCVSLEILDCAENCLKKLLLNNFPSLHNFSCKTNEIENLVISNCPQLKYFDFSFQTLTKKLEDGQVAFVSDIPNKVYIEKNSLSNIETLYTASESEIFYFERNGAKFVDSIFVDLEWEHLPKLKTFAVNHDPDISDFEEYLDKKNQEQEDQGYYSDEKQNPELKIRNEKANRTWLEFWLKLQAAKEKKNNTPEEFINFKNDLRYIDISGKKLVGKFVVENFPSLKSLNVSNNEIEYLVVKNCPELERLIISHNQIKKVEIEGCPNINYEYSYNKDGYVDPQEENKEDIKASQLLQKQNLTLEELFTLNFTELSEEYRHEAICLAENFLSPLTYEQLEEISTNIPRELVPIFIKLFTSKFKEKFQQENLNKEKEKQKKNEDLQKIAGLIVKAQKALKKNNLKELKKILAEIEKYCNTDSYTENKEIISNLKQGLRQELLKSIQQQLISNDNEPIKYPLIIGVSVVGVGFLVFLIKFLQRKIKRLVKLI